MNAQSSEAREEFRRAVERVIRRFEPRFQTVSVKLVDDPAQLDRTLRFRIDALMHAEPAPEYVSFDSTLNPGSHSFSVVGRRDG
jgi:type VI secretion system protein ImpF